MWCVPSTCDCHTNQTEEKNGRKREEMRAVVGDVGVVMELKTLLMMLSLLLCR
jgi:hypothetical protein